MREYIGDCQNCGKEIYCENGFFNGVSVSDGYLCFDCEEENNNH
ncbi:hypothetical protein [Gracilibacillus oryzae]|nr:hypothetical protein [Gracilibacillus oryzae]